MLYNNQWTSPFQGKVHWYVINIKIGCFGYWIEIRLDRSQIVIVIEISDALPKEILDNNHLCSFLHLHMGQSKFEMCMIAYSVLCVIENHDAFKLWRLCKFLCKSKWFFTVVTIYCKSKWFFTVVTIYMFHVSM